MADIEEPVSLRLDQQQGVETLLLETQTGTPRVIADRPLSEISSIIIQGSDADDHITIALNPSIATPVSFLDSNNDDRDVLSVVDGDRRWVIDGDNAGTVDNIAFQGVENLVGGSDNQDTFVFDSNGRLSGLVDGGSGGYDSLIYDSGSVVDRTSYVATGPDSGVLEFSSGRIEFAGLEPVIDTGIVANRTIDGTAVNDQLVLELDPDNPGNYRLRSVNGTMESLSFLAPSDSLTIRMGGGDDSLAITDDFAPGAGLDFTVLGEAGADTVTISAGVTVATRAFGGADPLTDASIGDSGNLLIQAEAVSVQTGGRLLAHADGGFLGGNVTLAAAVTQTGQASVATGVTLTGAVIRGEDISLTATSTLTSNTITSLVALLDVESSADVTVTGATQLTAAGNITLSAVSNVVASVEAQASGLGLVNVDAADATTLVDSTAQARVLGSSALSAGGTVSITAANSSDVDTLANGVTGGAGSAGGAVAVSVITTTTAATIGENATILQASNVDVIATTTDLHSTQATSTEQGATQNNPGTQALLTGANASTSDGAVTVAAAFAWNDTTSTTTSSIATSGTIASAGMVTVRSSTASDVSAIADASGVNGGPGVGVAVAVNHPNTTTEAYLDGTPTFSAAGVTVEALTGPAGRSFAANALSGAGGASVGVAGALAINITDNTSGARIRGGATPNLGNSDLTLTSINTATNTVSAIPETAGGSTGIGASVALNIAANPSTAELTATAVPVNIGNLSLNAQGDQTLVTTAHTGAQGGTAISTGVALGVGTNDTSALIGAGSALAITGQLTLDAAHVSNATTTASGAAAGPGVAVGTVLALGVEQDTATATIGRAVSAGGNVSLTADLSGGSLADAAAGTAGASALSDSANLVVTDQLSNALGQGAPISGVTAPAATTPDGSVDVAAALAMNLAFPQVAASVPSGTSLNTPGTVTLQASGDPDATARADASAVNSLTGVGVAVAINVPVTVIEASVGGSVAAASLIVQTLTSGDGTSSFMAQATSGAGATDVGVAGALALNLPTGLNEALIGSGGSVILSGGNTLLSAAAQTLSGANAISMALGVPRVGVGASVGTNVSSQTTRAELDSTATLTGANNLVLTALGDHTTNTSVDAGAQGGTAGAGAVAVSVTDNNTTTQIDAGVLLTLAGSLTLQATQRGATNTTSRSDTAGAQAMAGVALAINAAQDRASAGIDRDVASGGDITVQAITEATSSSNSVAGVVGNSDAVTTIDTQLATELGFYDPDAGTVNAIPLPDILAAIGPVETDVGVDVPTIGAAAAIGVNLAFSDATASIADGTTLSATGAVTVRSDMDSDGLALADAEATESGINIGAAFAVSFADVNNTASIGIGASISSGDIAVSAVTDSDDVTSGRNAFSAEARAGAGALTAGFAGAFGFNLLSLTTQAQVGSGAVLSSGEDITVHAMGKSSIANLADGDAGGTVAGIGAGVAINAIQDATRVDVLGTAQLDAVDDIDLRAHSERSFDTVSSGGTDAGETAVAGSVSVNALVATTVAQVAGSAQVNQGARPPSADQDLMLAAISDTTVVSRAGVEANGSGQTGIGAGVDTGLLSIDTQAILGGTVDTDRHISIIATASEDITSIAGASANTTAVSLAGSGSIYRLDGLTQAAVAPAASVTAQGNIIVQADDATEMDLNAGSSSLALGASPGAGIALGVLEKVTEGYIGAGAQVTAVGDRTAATVRDGSVTISFVNPVDEDGEIRLMDLDMPTDDTIGGAILNGVTDILPDLMGLLTPKVPPAPDLSLSEQRLSTPATRANFHGLSVSALSRDDIETLGVGTGAALGVSAEFSASGLVSLNRTAAFIGNNATVVAGTPGVSGQDQILIAAGSDTYHMGIAGVAGAALGSAVGLSTTLSVINNQTDAYIGNMANVQAMGDISVLAFAQEDVLGVAGSAGASLLLNVIGSIPLISVDAITRAFIDANAVVDTDRNLLVESLDHTDADVVAGTASLGLLVGVGASGTAVVIDKDTQAFIGANADVDAKGNGLEQTVLAGTVAETSAGLDTEGMVGVAVQAVASEDVFSFAATGGGGFGVGVTGTLTASVIDSNTSAFIAGGAQVNVDPTNANAAQEVSVGAGNDAHLFGLPINLNGGGSIAIGGAVDLMLFRSDTTAHIDAGADVRARQDIEVNAVSLIDDGSLSGGAGVTGGIGLTMSFGLHAIRGDLNQAVLFDLNGEVVLDGSGLGFLDTADGASADTLQGYIDQVITTLVAPAGNGISGVLNNYATGIGGGNAGATALSASTPTSAFAGAAETAPAGSGTAAYIDGATVQAGRDVLISAEEQIDASLDTSYNFAFAVGEDSLINVPLDGGILFTGGIADAYITGAANVTAVRDIKLSALVESTQIISSTIPINNTANRIRAFIDGGSVDAGQDVVLDATGTTTAEYSSLLPSYDAGLKLKYSLNRIANTIDAHISGTASVEADRNVDLNATDNATIDVISNAMTVLDEGMFGGGLTVAATFSTNRILSQVTAYIDGATVQSLGGDVTLDAVSQPHIRAIALGGAQGEAFLTIGGAASFNSFQTVIDAHISNGADVDATGAIAVSARDTSVIEAYTGGIAALSGTVGVGAGFSWNKTNNIVRAYIDGSAVTSSGGSVIVSANASPRITSWAVGGSFANDFDLGGAITLHEINNQVLAYISGATASVSAATAVNVTALDGSVDEVRSGGLAISVSGYASIGAAVATNDIANSVQAYVDAATVTAAQINVTATSNADIHAITVGGAGAEYFALGGALSKNLIGGSITARVTGGANLTATGQLEVAGVDNSGMFILAGGAAIAENAAVGAAVGLNEVTNSLNVYVDDANVTSTTGGVRLRGEATPTLSIIAVGGAAASDAAIAGSFATNTVANTLDVRAQNAANLDAATLLEIKARQTSDIDVLSGAVTGAGTAAVAGAISVTELGGMVQARAASQSQLDSTDDIAITANRSDNVLSISASGAFAGTAGITGSSTVLTTTTTTSARIEGAPAGVTPGVIAGGGVSISADGDLTGKLIAGVVGGAGTAAVGASNVTLLTTDRVEAYVGERVSLTTAGTTGLLVAATSSEDIIAISAAGTAAGSAAVAGSANYLELGETTQAWIGRSALLASSHTSGDVSVQADADTTVVSIAGSLAAAGAAAVGLGADIVNVTKITEAWIDSGVGVAAGGDVLVTATSNEDFTSVAAGVGAAGSAAVTLDASVHLLNLITRAWIGDDPDDAVASSGPGLVLASDSVIIWADDKTEIDKVVGVLAIGGFAGVGAAGGVSIVDKRTEAFIGAGARVVGEGNGSYHTIKTGAISPTIIGAAQFDPNDAGGEGIEGSTDATMNADSSTLSGEGEVKVPLMGAMNADQQGGNDLSDNSLSGQRIANLGTRSSFRGVSVSATNRDDIETFTISLAGGTAGVAISAAVNVVDTATRAYIGANALVNSPPTAGTNGSQRVHVGAGNDFYHMAVAGTLAAGVVGVSPAADVTLVTAVTEASIRQGAVVNAANDVTVESHAKEDLLLMGFGIAAGVVGIGGAVSVLTFDTTTTATIDAGAEVGAGGDVLVLASDDTETTMVSGALAGGFVGVGASVGVLDIDKSTQALIDTGARVDAKGAGTGIGGVLNGGMVGDGND
ncbi:MAG: hypothetical protein GY713_23190, partial [Actinomycetia bacterium]|nr:hypothetical protein [Actinomycetes bacterium]